MISDVRREGLIGTGSGALVCKDVIADEEAINQLGALVALNIEPGASWDRVFLWSDEGGDARDLTSNPSVTKGRMRVFNKRTRRLFHDWNSDAFNATTNPGGGRVDLTAKASGKIAVELEPDQTTFSVLKFEVADYALEVLAGTDWIRLAEGEIKLAKGE